jgi:hypothetical protein
VSKRIFFLIVFILQYTLAAKAERVTVMLYAGKSLQGDTLGYNVVSDLSDVIYRAIMNGTAQLWDSEKKTLQIEPATLRKIERSSSVTFSGCEHLFIYEVWTLEKKLGSAEIAGFYFSTPDKSGQPVAFGYVDAKELPDTLLGTFIQQNTNGGEPITLLRVLRCKMYQYDVVQYKGKKVEGALEALEIKKEKATHLLSFLSCPPLREIKQVVYNIVLNDTLAEKESTVKANLLLETLEDFFTDNREVLLNMGGAATLEFKTNKTFKVTALRVSEIWTKENNVINMEPQIITLFINNRPVNALSVKEFLAFGIVYDFKTIYDVLKEKNFAFRILQINGNEIQTGQCRSYLNALRKYKWNGLTEYVKYD